VKSQIFHEKAGGCIFFYLPPKTTPEMEESDVHALIKKWEKKSVWRNQGWAFVVETEVRIQITRNPSPGAEREINKITIDISKSPSSLPHLIIRD
jgi:hypothetical protein